MRQKSTVSSLEFHNQFQQSEEQIRKKTKEAEERKKKDVRQGQSNWWVKKETKQS